MNRISLSSTGFYKTPKIHVNKKTLKGRPFLYFSYGAAVSEVIVDTLTGENKLTQVDILHDVGNSINPRIDIGQIEGGFTQGLGWLTTEEISWDKKGLIKREILNKQDDINQKSIQNFEEEWKNRFSPLSSNKNTILDNSEFI